MTEKQKVLVISHVIPIKLNSGQELRVYYTLKALKETCEVTFLTFCKDEEKKKIITGLGELCDEFILLPTLQSGSFLVKIINRLKAHIFSLRTGLKLSNYHIGEVEFSPSRIKNAIGNKVFDLAIFEYFHAWRSAFVFKEKGIPTVLDMHNILWQSYLRQKQLKSKLPVFIKKHYFKLYKKAEENSWSAFDYLIAINKTEFEYVNEHTDGKMKVIFMPMGIDITQWNYLWKPSKNPVLAYYGNLGTTHNADDAMECAQVIMPEIWKEFPEAELLIVGSNPPQRILELTKNNKIRVTGFVEFVQPVLGTATIMIIPWKGTYGFRSRIVEVMALGLPVVATYDAVDGMEMKNGQGIFLAKSTSEMVIPIINMLTIPSLLESQSKTARKVAEEMYNYEVTYLKALGEILKSVTN